MWMHNSQKANKHGKMFGLIKECELKWEIISASKWSKI